MSEDSVRRLLVTLAGISAPFIAGLLAKYGIAVSTEQVIGAQVAVALYVGQSVVNAIHSRNVAAATAVAPTPAAAVADLNKGPA